MLNKFVEREALHKLKGEPPGNSGRGENEALAGLGAISLRTNAFRRDGKNDRALVASSNVGTRMFRLQTAKGFEMQVGNLVDDPKMLV